MYTIIWKIQTLLKWYFSNWSKSNLVTIRIFYAFTSNWVSDPFTSLVTDPVYFCIGKLFLIGLYDVGRILYSVSSYSVSVGFEP